jgi:hypothetical protein
MSHVPFPSLRHRARPAHRVLLTLGAACALSCSNLEGFNSKPGEAYCGKIGIPDFQDGFVDENSPSNLKLALVLDTGQLSGEPGRLTSDDLQGICGTADAPQVLFSNAPLRAIPALQHDVLSALTFGEGHDHDFFAWVDSTCQGTMLAVVSLMKSNYVELRLFKPAAYPPPKPTPAETPGFALFHLRPKPLYRSETKGGCGFPP